MDVKPWEPVRSWLTCKDDVLDNWDIAEDPQHESWKCNDDKINGIFALRVTLANGQRIIVRALSDERKAARAAMKGAGV